MRERRTRWSSSRPRARPGCEVYLPPARPEAKPTEGEENEPGQPNQHRRPRLGNPGSDFVADLKYVAEIGPKYTGGVRRGSEPVHIVPDLHRAAESRSDRRGRARAGPLPHTDTRDLRSRRVPGILHDDLEGEEIRESPARAGHVPRRSLRTRCRREGWSPTSCGS